MKDYSKSEFNAKKVPEKELKALLSKEELDYIPQLKALNKENFILYGSLASTLQMKHRHSKDFDFFTDRQISTDELEAKLKNLLPFFGTAQVLKKEENILVFQTADNVIFSFFTHISSGRVGKPLNYEGLTLASLEDLFAYKVNKLAKRVRISDYQDLAAFLGFKLSLSEAFLNAKALFKEDFSFKDTTQAISNFIVSQNFLELDPIMKENLISSLIALDQLTSEEMSGKILSPSLF